MKMLLMCLETVTSESVDGESEQIVDLYVAQRAGAQFVYLRPQLPTGQHILRLRVTGERNAASTGPTVSVDRAEIY
jgi:hypothetical protein